MITTVVLVVLMLCVLGLFTWVLVLADRVSSLKRLERMNERDIDRLTAWVTDPKRVMDQIRDRVKRDGVA
jgi:hypothetical protein